MGGRDGTVRKLEKKSEEGGVREWEIRTAEVQMRGVGGSKRMRVRGT